MTPMIPAMFAGLSDMRRKVLRSILNAVLVVCALTGLALFVLILGWPVDTEESGLVRVATHCVLTLFVAQTFLRAMLEKNPIRHFFASQKLEMLLAIFIFCDAIFGEEFHSWLHMIFPEVAPKTLALFLLGCTQVSFLALIALRFLRQSSLLATRRLTPGSVFIFSFAFLILSGTLLLMTPRATFDGITFIDAFFTATSAVCVNGLSTIDIASGFTRQGLWIILGLMQIGGLGMMTLTYFFAYFLAGGVSLRNQIALQNLLSEDNLGQIGTVLGMIVGFTLTCETAGAAAIYFCLEKSMAPIDDPIFFSIFHSISAFCNAGISTLPGNLENQKISGIHSVLGVLMILVIIGGIGFPVLKNFWEVSIATLRKKIGLRTAIPPRLNTNSRVVLMTTLVLISGGAILIFLTEYVFSKNMGHLSDTIFAAVFQSVTTRSAGFNDTDVALLEPATLIVIMALMFIGGSPSSTAGGIKTSTVAVAFLSLRRVVLGLPEIEAFGRRISDDTANRALSIVLLTVSFFLLIATMLCALHPQLPTFDVVFETMSATSSAGISRGISPQLSITGKIMMIAAMFVGRIGVLTFLLVFIRKREHTAYHLPETNVIIA